MGPDASAGTSDINDLTRVDWLPLGAPKSNSSAPTRHADLKNFTPPFPAYPSGHATFGAAALREDARRVDRAGRGGDAGGGALPRVLRRAGGHDGGRGLFCGAESESARRREWGATLQAEVGVPSVPPNTPWSEREFEGVTLALQMWIHAGLAEGFALDELLAAQGLTPERWARAEEAWGDALLDTDDEAAEVAHDASALAAQDSFARALPPIDRALGPWLDFVRAFGAQEEPAAWLGARGLRSADVLRLHRVWSRRLADEPTLREEALALLAAPAGPAPEVTPGPRPTLAQRTAAEAKPAPAPLDEDDEDDDDDASPPAARPPLFLRMPGDEAPAAAAPPEFQAPSLPPASSPFPVVPSAPRAALPPAPSVQLSLGATVTSAPSPFRAPLPFAATSSTASRPANRPAPDPLNATVSFLSAEVRSHGPALPFRPAGAAVPPPPASDPGSTAPPQASPLPTALPFRGEASAPPATLPRPAGDVGATAPSTPSSVRSATPFPSAPAQALPTLSLDAYALLCAELAEAREPAERVFARHGLASHEARVGVDRAWRERLRQDPSLYRVYQTRHAHHRATLAATRTPKP
jgi:hypothetical protein